MKKTSMLPLKATDLALSAAERPQDHLKGLLDQSRVPLLCLKEESESASYISFNKHHHGPILTKDL